MRRYPGRVCTVVIRVPENPADDVRMLAVRDEDPARAWDRLGAHWPERPGVVGVRDRLAAGAWLAARPDAGRVAVIVNREGIPDLPPERIASRGRIALDAVEGNGIADPETLGFHLVEIAGHHAGVTTWDGQRLTRRELEPGTHMLAHDEVDDPSTARIAAWLDAFATAPTDGADWSRAWLEVLAGSARLDPADDRAIVRDNRPHGYPTMSLLVCTASVGDGSADVRYAEFAEPARWNPLEFTAAAAAS